MKYYQVFLCLILSFSFTLQNQQTLEIKTLTGFENNINRTPNTLIEDGEILNKEDFHLNSFYQDLQVNYKYRKKWNSHIFSFYLNPEYRYYFTEPEANTAVINTRLYYRHFLRKNFFWENNLRYKLKNRSGQDLDENELSLPFGYKLLRMDSGLRFRMSKRNRTYVKFNFGDKQFDPLNNRSVGYLFYGISGEFKQIKWRNHLLSSYGLNIEYSRRNYNIDDFDEEETMQRTWVYYNSGLFYNKEITKFLELNTDITYQRRDDVTNNMFGYNQITAKVGFQHKNRNWNSLISASYSYRVFDNLNANNSQNQSLGKLNYKYLRIKLRSEYQISRNLNIVFDGYVINRKSNNSNVNTNAFRSYMNNYAGIGISYTF